MPLLSVLIMKYTRRENTGLTKLLYIEWYLVTTFEYFVGHFNSIKALWAQDKIWFAPTIEVNDIAYFQC